MQNTLSEKNCINSIVRMLQNVQGLIDFDNRVYTEAFGVETVSIIQKQAEVMPDTEKEGFAIQAMLNIAYDQGYQDCVSMIIRVIESCEVTPDAALS
jgi:hypothetical protein